MIHKTPLPFIALSIALAVFSYQQYKNAQSASAKLQAAQNELITIQKKFSEPAMISDTQTSAPTAASADQSSEYGQQRTNTAPNHSPDKPYLASPDPIGVGKLATSYFIKDLEKEMVLSEGEKELVRERVQDFITRGVPLSAEASVKILEGIIDDKRFTKFRNDTLQRDAHEKAQRLHASAAFLSQKLKLTPEQQVKIGSVLSEMREELAPIADAIRQQTASFRAKLMQGNMNQETLVQGHQDMDASYKNYSERKKELLNTRLQNLLTEEQYNILLESQASSDSFIEQSTNF